MTPDTEDQEPPIMRWLMSLGERTRPDAPTFAEDPAPERALHRNVTMIPARGGRVVARSRLG